MDILNRDEFQMIISFLSLDDKINLSLSCKNFKTLVSKQEIALNSIEKKVHHFFSLVMKPGSELVLAVNNNFIMYVDESSTYISRGIHRHFRISRSIHNHFGLPNPNSICINSDCQEKRLDNIYISVHRGHIPQFLRTMYYIQRKVPYCIGCFNKWGVDAYIHHPQRK